MGPMNLQWLKLKTLEGRLTASHILIATIPAAILGASVLWGVAWFLDRAIEDRAADASQRLRNRIVSLGPASVFLADRLGQHPAVLAALDGRPGGAAGIHDLAQRFGVRLIRILDGSGRTVASGSREGDVENTAEWLSVGTRREITTTDSPEGFWGIEATGRGLVIWAAAPVAGSGRRRGLVVVGNPLDAKFAADIGEATGLDIFFIMDGQVYATTAYNILSAEHVRQPLPSDVWLAVLRSQSPKVRAVYERAPYTVSYQPLADIRSGVVGALAAALPRARAEQARTLALMSFLSVLGLGLGLSSIAGRISARRLAGPVTALRNAAQAVGRGDLGVQVAESGPEEMMNLARAFNEMVDGLREGRTLKSYAPADMIRRYGQVEGMRQVRVDATILFIDLAGFTRASETREPGDIVTLVNDCFTVIVGEIQAAGGHVDSFIGDAVMAVFGLVDSRSDDTARAVQAAVNARDRLEARAVEFAERFGWKPRLHAGVNAGPVVAGDVGVAGRKQFTVIGDVVNVAQRLCDAASAGQILVTWKTHEAVRHLFDCQPMPPMRLPGLSSVVALYDVIAARADLRVVG